MVCVTYIGRFSIISGRRRYQTVATGENFAWSLPTPLIATIRISNSWPGRSLAIRMSFSTGPGLGVDSFPSM